MKTSFFALACAGLCALFAAAGCTTTPAEAARAARPARLQLAIIVPASMNMLRDDDVIDAFDESVRDTLHQSGFRGRIKLLDETEKAAPDIPLLEINLTEWRVDPTGNVTCTFGATLRANGETRGLGLFTGTSLLTWGRRDWVTRSDSFQDAAHHALSDLANRMEQTGLITKLPRTT